MTFKFTKLGSLLIASLFNAAAHVRALDENKLLSCIAQVETGTTDFDKPCRKIGRQGERSAWQIKAGTWHQYTKAPFTLASTSTYEANLVAAAHLRLLRIHLEYALNHSSPYLIALAWNAGLDRVVKNKAPDAAHDYAQRVTNLYNAERP